MFVHFPGSLLAQQALIRGRILSGGLPLAGVTVTLKGTTHATVSDSAGHFTLQAPGNGTLIFTYVNYGSVEQSIKGRKVIDISLEPVDKSLGDIIVVGYGTQKKATLTGSISVVQGADLVKSPQADLSNSFAGRFSGLIANNTSGEPGYDGSSILIRGWLLPGATMYWW